MAGLTIGLMGFMGLGFGWIITIIVLAFLLIIWVKTPAMTFLKASMTGKCIVQCKDRSGSSIFRTGRITDYGVINVDKLGLVLIQENSKTLDRKSKIDLFRVFTEFGSTLPNDFEEIITELRSLGETINNYKDYERVIKLGGDEIFASEYLESISDEKIKAQVRKTIERLKALKINIKPFKTYNITELSNMFPFNINPVQVDNIVTAESNLALKNLGMSQKVWVAIGIAVLLILVGVGVLYMLVGKSNPEIIIKTIETGVQTAGVANASLTMP